MKPEPDRSFGPRLKQVLDLRGLSARKLDAAMKRAGYTSKVLRGDRIVPEVRTIRQMADILSVTLMWLCFGEGHAPTKDGKGPGNIGPSAQLRAESALAA